MRVCATDVPLINAVSVTYPFCPIRIFPVYCLALTIVMPLRPIILQYRELGACSGCYADPRKSVLLHSAFQITRPLTVCGRSRQTRCTYYQLTTTDTQIGAFSTNPSVIRTLVGVKRCRTEIYPFQRVMGRLFLLSRLTFLRVR